MTTPTPLEWSALWAAMDATPTEWIETTEQMYWDMLECVPPRAQAGGRFLVGEPKTHVNGIAIHACFWDRGNGRYFARYMTVAEFHNPQPEACPDLPKGQKCQLCGGSWVCLRAELPKAAT